MERDPVTNKFTAKTKISTHTLTWSVTSDIKNYPYNYYISTHTLTWSVTNETTDKTKNKNISTHTLTWSVTR